MLALLAMSCQCYQVGGPFISEDPDCPAHGAEAQQRAASAQAALDERDDRIAALDARVAALEARFLPVRRCSFVWTPGVITSPDRPTVSTRCFRPEGHDGEHAWSMAAAPELLGPR